MTVLFFKITLAQCGELHRDSLSNSDASQRETGGA